MGLSGRFASGSFVSTYRKAGLRKQEAILKIKEEGAKETAKIQKTSYLLQGFFWKGTQRIKRGFDLMLDVQTLLSKIGFSP
jgi:hypothetical protein